MHGVLRTLIENLLNFCKSFISHIQSISYIPLYLRGLDRIRVRPCRALLVGAPCGDVALACTVPSQGESGSQLTMSPSACLSSVA